MRSNLSDMPVFVCYPVQFGTVVLWTDRLLTPLMLCFMIETLFLPVIIAPTWRRHENVKFFSLIKDHQWLWAHPPPTPQVTISFPGSSLPPSLSSPVCSLLDLSCLTCKKLRKPKPLCPHLSVSCLSVMLNHFSFFQDLDPDAQFISESLSFDVVPGKLGEWWMWCPAIVVTIIL